MDLVHRHTKAATQSRRMEFLLYVFTIFAPQSGGKNYPIQILESFKLAAKEFLSLQLSGSIRIFLLLYWLTFCVFMIVV